MMLKRAKLCQLQIPALLLFTLAGCGGATSGGDPQTEAGSGGVSGSAGHGGTASGGLTNSGGTRNEGGTSGAGGAQCVEGDGAALPRRPFCFSDSDCSDGLRCDQSSCYSSSCWCTNGVWACTSDCRHVCVDGAGGTSGGGSGGSAGIAGSGGSVGGGGVGGVGGGVPLDPSSWDVQVKVERTSDPLLSFVPECASFAFTARAEPSGDGADLIMGRNGEIFEETIVRTDDFYSVTEPLLVPSSDCLSTSIAFTTLSLSALDLDGDGKGDLLSGGGQGYAEVFSGDIVDRYELNFELSGTPDRTAPRVKLELNTDGSIVAHASEPLAQGAVVRLVGTSTVELPASSAPKTPITFVSSANLPFSGEWKLEVAAKDLAGLSAVGMGTLSTLPDPGVFAADGFEGPLAAKLDGGAKVVSGVGDIPAISGSKSLFVPRVSQATLHLARTGDHLRLKARALSTYAETQVLFAITAGVIGGTQRVSPMPVSGIAMSATGDTDYAYASDPLLIDLTLNEPGDDVLVTITPHGDCPFCPEYAALLIDDLRIE